MSFGSLTEIFYMLRAWDLYVGVFDLVKLGVP
jgi:hypothetical protein